MKVSFNYSRVNYTVSLLYYPGYIFLTLDKTHKPKPCITNDNHVDYIKDFEEMMMKGTVYCNAQHLLAKINIYLSLIKY